MIERGKITEKSGMVFVDDGSTDGTWHILTQSFNKRYAMILAMLRILLSLWNL